MAFCFDLRISTFIVEKRIDLIIEPILLIIYEYMLIGKKVFFIY